MTRLRGVATKPNLCLEGMALHFSSADQLSDSVRERKLYSAGTPNVCTWRQRASAINLGEHTESVMSNTVFVSEPLLRSLISGSQERFQARDERWMSLFLGRGWSS
jgi:hypothetical protein